MTRLPGSVLFACNYNSIRSPMAAALLRRLHSRRIFVDSVGIRGLPIDPFVVAVMEEMGIDLASHRPKSFEELEDGSFDLVVSLTPQAQHRAVELTRSMACEVEFWPTHEPGAVEGNRAEILAAYRALRDDLWRRIRERFPPGITGQV
ncbi:MAG TPA: low molecular weight phosphatase family protein [Stellaceae bacterium]|nr:low molecular weight phosphatase family protein [Stellaceae bacterium]